MQNVPDSIGHQAIRPFRLVGWGLGVVLGLGTAVAADPAEPGARRPDSADTQAVPKTAGENPSLSDGGDLPVPGDELMDIELLEMDVPTVITAMRWRKRFEEVPYAVSMVSAEDIRASGVRTVQDALRLVPGVDVAEMGWNYSATNVRGQHEMLARQLLVLVDGRQIFDSLFGATNWGTWPFMLEDIERIEVIRGPAGVVWGPNAVNGVINIITKDPADQRGLTVRGGGGTQGFYREYAGVGYSDGKLRLRVSQEFEGSSGFERGGSLLHELKDDLKMVRSNLHAIYEASPDDTVTISGGNATGRGGIPEGPLYSPLRYQHSESQTSFVMGRWDHRISSDESFYLNAFVNDAFQRSASKTYEYRYQQLAFQLGHTFKPAPDHTVTWGIDSRTDLLDGSNADPFMLTEQFISTAIIGLYIQDEWRFADRWSLTLGGRIDYEFYGGFEPSARIALAYHLDQDSILHASVSRAFQSPPVGSRFLRVPFLEGLSFLTTEPGFEEEHLIAYEVGYRGSPIDRLHLGATAFCHSYDDAHILKMRPGPPGLIKIRAENGYSAVIYGLELDGRYKVTDNLELLGNYTFQAFDLLGKGALFDTDRMSPPRHKFMVGTRYSPIDPLHLSAHLYFVDEVTAPDPLLPGFHRKEIGEYFRLDLRAEYELIKDRAWLSAGVRNLLDDHHPEGASQLAEYAEVPRMVYAELRLRLE